MKRQLRNLLTVLGKELRSALRDRNVVLYSLVMPLVLYPLLLWAALEVVGYAMGRAEQLVVQVSVADDAPELAALRTELALQENVVAGELKPESALIGGRVDALVTWREGAFVVAYHGGRESSRIALERLNEVIHDLRTRRLRREALALGLQAEAAEGFAIDEVDMAAPSDRGRRLLDSLGLLVVAMAFMGALYPAVEMTAGERERGGWEALLSTGADRSAIAAAKFIATCCFSVFAALANLLGVVLATRFVLLRLGEGDLQFDLPWLSWPLIGLSIVAVALLASAATLAVALQSNTYREAQAAAGPIVAVGMVPAFAGLTPGLELSYATALIPVTNLTLIFRQALRGEYAWGPMLLALLVVLVCAAAAIVIGARRMDPETLIGARPLSTGGLLQRLKTALAGRPHTREGS